MVRIYHWNTSPQIFTQSQYTFVYAINKSMVVYSVRVQYGYPVQALMLLSQFKFATFVRGNVSHFVSDSVNLIYILDFPKNIVIVKFKYTSPNSAYQRIWTKY